MIYNTLLILSRNDINNYNFFPLFKCNSLIIIIFKAHNIIKLTLYLNNIIYLVNKL